MSQIPMFADLYIETHGACNRSCPTCIRQSYPRKARIAQRQEYIELPILTITSLIDQAAAMNFTGRLCLSHFNEPLLDMRIPWIADYAREHGKFSEVYLSTNGDPLTQELAHKLDGVLHRIQITLYWDAEKRQALYSSWFKRTRCMIYAASHITTHYSPHADLTERIARNRSRPCIVEAQQRMIIGFTGDMLMCCEDISQQFDLGTVATQSLQELWYSPKHQKIVETLAQPGGRERYAYCKSCPRE